MEMILETTKKKIFKGSDPVSHKKVQIKTE